MTAGLLNADDENLGRDVLDDTRRALTQALAAGQRVRARMLVRFLAALVASNVLMADAFLGLVQRLVDRALTLARAGASHDLCSSSYGFVYGRLKKFVHQMAFWGALAHLTVLSPSPDLLICAADR
jgi:hypothetical protein